MNFSRKDYLKNVKKVVVKVGTSTLTHSTGLLNLRRIENLARQISDMHNQGIQVVLVSSGAIGSGIGKLNLKNRPKTIPEKQAAAAVGQVTLMHMYGKLFSEYNKIISQILLTKRDISYRPSFLNARNSILTLLNLGVIPIVNENDAVVVDEIKVGDNDTLSALVSNLVDADLLIILSDIDGFYDADPRTNKNAKLIHYINEINEDIRAVAGGAGTNLGTGGMSTKINAAEIAMSSGSAMVIVNGSTPNVINDVLDGKDVGTFFSPNKEPLNSRKCWISYSTQTKGNLKIDSGAVEALTKNNTSLLPSGIISIEGLFEAGDIVSIVDSSNIEIARGITNYNSHEINLIKGFNTSNIEEKLGYKTYNTVVHVDNMVIKNNCL